MSRALKRAYVCWSSSSCSIATRHLHRIHLELPGRALGPKAPAFELERRPVELLACRAGHQHLAFPGSLGDARGDVDVDPEVVASQLARAAHVNPCAQPRLVAVDAHFRHRATRLQRGRDRRAGTVEYGHQAVAQALYDPPAAIADRRLPHRPDLPKQLQRGLVTRFERPRGEVDEVREEDRKLALAAPPS